MLIRKLSVVVAAAAMALAPAISQAAPIGRAAEATAEENALRGRSPLLILLIILTLAALVAALSGSSEPTSP